VNAAALFSPAGVQENTSFTQVLVLAVGGLLEVTGCAAATQAILTYNLKVRNQGPSRSVERRRLDYTAAEIYV
jgi:hypothetical protein